MANPLHKTLSGTEIHVPHTWSFANAAAREITIGFTAGDVGKWAMDIDTGKYFVLKAQATPTQQPVAPSDVDASEGAKGNIQLATQAEVDTGTDTVKAVTPATLKNVVDAIPAPASATESAEGLVELATTAEAQAGTDTAKAVTPLGLEARITDLISGSPATLDTLNEIAQAFNDDPNFATNITNLITSFHGWEIKTSDFTAVENTRYFIDTSGAIVNVTMPASPSLSDFCQFHDLSGNFDTNKVNLLRNGENIMSLAEDSELTTKYMSTKMVFSNATHGWRFVS